MKRIVVQAIEVWTPVADEPRLYITLTAKSTSARGTTFEFRVIGGPVTSVKLTDLLTKVRVPVYADVVKAGDLQVRNMDSCGDVIISDIRIELPSD